MPDHAQPSNGLLLGDKTYDKFRHVVQYWIPALGTFYAGIATIWNLPYGVEVVGSLTALATLMGVILGISKSTYYKTDSNFDGAFVVDDEQNVSMLDVRTSVEDMTKQKTITLKVEHAPGALTPLSEQDNISDGSQD